MNMEKARDSVALMANLLGHPSHSTVGGKIQERRKREEKREKKKRDFINLKAYVSGGLVTSGDSHTGNFLSRSGAVTC